MSSSLQYRTYLRAIKVVPQRSAGDSKEKEVKHVRRQIASTNIKTHENNVVNDVSSHGSHNGRILSARNVGKRISPPACHSNGDRCKELKRAK